MRAAASHEEGRVLDGRDNEQARATGTELYGRRLYEVMR
jgi:hypothetical protein